LTAYQAAKPESLRVEDMGALPDRPGVYIFKGEGGRVLYVGKAQSLRKRVRSYFSKSAPDNPRLVQLREAIRGIDYLVTANAAEALILENNLIKRLRPAYNIMLRDDKSYPYIAITVEEDYPRVFLYRGEKKKGVLYYGPYWHAGSARETLEALRKAYPFRTCRGERPGRGRRGPCLDRHIGLCPGPCRGGVNVHDYRAGVERVQRFLEGRGRELLDDLENKMRREAASQEFEKAARYRDVLKSLERILEKQNAVTRGGDDLDVIGISVDELDACVTVLLVRSGQITGKRDYVFPRPPEEGMVDLLGDFLEAYYGTAAVAPKQILVPFELEEQAAGVLAGWMEQSSGHAVKIRRPQRGEKRELLARAVQNAEVRLQMAKLKRASDLKWISSAISTMTRELSLERTPYRIECFDVSNLGEGQVVGSMVVFEGGLPLKREYRKFRLKDDARDDSSRIYEVLRRRLQKLKEAPDREIGAADGCRERLTSFQKTPDLLLIDGGRAQLNAALRALEESSLEGIELASLAKRLECVYRPGISAPIILPGDSQALYFLQRVRDEAHRFAVGYHRDLRDREMRSSRLDGVRGIGKVRKAKLMERYGSLERITRASLEELKGLPFMDESSAENLYRSLHGESAT
jgi:excinuclease ABC subunit C